MIIMVDTNILVSALLFPDSKPAQALLHAARHHDLVLCDHIVREIHDVVRRKWPHLLADVDVLLAELPFDLVFAPQEAGLEQPTVMTVAQYHEMMDLE